MRDSRRYDPRRSARGERALLVAFVATACWMLVDSDRMAAVRDGAVGVRAWLVPPAATELDPDERARYESELAAARVALVAMGDELRGAREQLARARSVDERLALGDAYRLIPARVIARSEPRERRRVIVIARGLDDGVAPGMPAVAGAAFVGKVISATARTSRVALATDPTCRVLASIVVPGKPPRSGGACAGTLRAIELRFVTVDEAPAAGALVVTSGAASRIPPGLVIGRVAAVDRAGDRYEAGVVVEPAVDAFALDTIHLLDLGAPVATVEEPSPKGRPDSEAPAADPPGR